MTRSYDSQSVALDTRGICLTRHCFAGQGRGCGVWGETALLAAIYWHTPYHTAFVGHLALRLVMRCHAMRPAHFVTTP